MRFGFFNIIFTDSYHCRGSSFLLLILPLLYHCCDQAWRTRVRTISDRIFDHRFEYFIVSWKETIARRETSFLKLETNVKRLRSNIVRKKWLNHNVISNNSFWLLIYAWKKTAWNAPRKEIFGSNIFRHFRKPDFSSKRHLVLVKYCLSSDEHIKSNKKRVTEITSIQLNSGIPQNICIWFSSAELRKTDDLFRSFALTGFCESLNF